MTDVEQGGRVALITGGSRGIGAAGRLFDALDVERLTTEPHASVDLTAALDIARRAGLTQR